MNNLEHKTNKSERDEKSPEISFDKKKGTLLIGIEKNPEDVGKVRTLADKKSLLEKDETHLTIIGSNTAEEIFASLEKLAPDEQEVILSKIKELIDETNWKFSLKPEFYYIKKDYNDPDPNNSDQTIPETRESIIQIAEIENLVKFYDHLQEITDLKFEIPLPHVTLFTISTREDKKKRGIGIYSYRDFESLNPERLEVS